MNQFVINSTIADIANDIRETRDPIKRTILERFLSIKMNQLRSEAEDPSLDDLSENYEDSDSSSTHDQSQSTSQSTSQSKTQTKTNKSQSKSQTKTKTQSKTKTKSIAEIEYESIIKDQKHSLDELDKIAKIKAYSEIINDNRKDRDQKDLIKTRGDKEKMWESKAIYDPRYIEYQKDDVMNNKLMERLNSEIDFRMDDPRRTKIEKPFNDDIDGMEEYAVYEPSSEEDRYKTKKVLGKRRQLRK